MIVSGVYAIQHLESGRTYVGSSSHMDRRWREHVSLLNNGKHHSKMLQADWVRYGATAFVFVVLERISDQKSRIACEQINIDLLASTKVYNENRRAGSGPRAGFKHSAESIEKMRSANAGKPKSEIHRARLSKARTGHVKSPETCEKLRISHLGHKHSDATRKKMSETMKRVPHTWGAAISAGKTGRPWSKARREAFLRKVTI